MKKFNSNFDLMALILSFYNTKKGAQTKENALYLFLN